MTTKVENKIEFCEKYQHLGVYLAIAMLDIDVTDAPKGMWTPQCQLWPHRKWASYWKKGGSNSPLGCQFNGS